MKNAKRIASLLLALAMVFAMALSVSALTEVPADTGSILIKDNDTVKASQKTFAAFKILDLKAYADENGEIQTYEYSVPASLADFYANRYGLDKTASDFATKVIASIADEEDIYAFAEAAMEAATAAPYTGKPVTNGYKFSGLPLGYYVISDTTPSGDFVKPVSALLLDTATPDVEIEVKAEKPPVDKFIDEDNDLTTEDDRVEANEAAIGDTVTYVITSKVPDMTGFDKYFFIINDNMTKGLTFTNNMKVTVGDKVLTAGTDYILTTTDNEDHSTSLKIVFVNFLQYNTDEFIGKPIEVSYTAELNEYAETYKLPNKNEVYLQYSNDPNEDYEGENEPNPNEPPIGETPKEETRTYTTSLKITKTDPIANRLQGAEFTLSGQAMNIVRVERESFVEDENGNYWLLTDGSYTTTAPDSLIDGAPVDTSKYDPTMKKFTKNTSVELIETPEDVVATGTVGQDGILRFEGLKSGTYTIKEIKAPEGYNILTEELQVTISFDKDTETFTYEGAADENGVAAITVINQAGSELPTTGGMGTTIFYIVGGILVLAAVVVLVSRKRMAA